MQAAAGNKVSAFQRHLTYMFTNSAMLTTITATCTCLHVEPRFHNTVGSENEALPVIILRPHPAEGPVVKGGQGGLRWRRRAAIALLQLEFLAHAWVLLQLAHVHLHAKHNVGNAPILSSFNSRSMQVRQIAEGLQADCCVPDLVMRVSVLLA